MIKSVPSSRHKGQNVTYGTLNIIYYFLIIVGVFLQVVNMSSRLSMFKTKVTLVSHSLL